VVRGGRPRLDDDHARRVLVVDQDLERLQAVERRGLFERLADRTLECVFGGVALELDLEQDGHRHGEPFVSGVQANP